MQNPEDQRARELLTQLNHGKSQLEELHKQGQMIESAVIELRATLEVLAGLKNQKVGDEILVQVGSGSFIKASIKDNENVLVGVGGNMNLEKKADEAVEIMEDRKRQLMQSLEQVQQTMGGLSIQMSQLQKMADQVISQQMQRPGQ